MRYYLVVSCLIAVCASAAEWYPSQLSPDGALPSPRGALDLDLAPHVRWDSLVRETIARHGFDHTFRNLMLEIAEALPRVEYLALWMQNITLTRFPVYFAEIEGIVASLNSLNYTERDGVSVLTFTVLNWLPELSIVNWTGSSKHEALGFNKLFGSRSCTSLVARTADGTILHARNDDASASHTMTNLTIDVDIIEAGSIVAKSTVFLGSVGMYTTLRAGIASLTEDQRVHYAPDGSVYLYTPETYMTMIDALPTAGPNAFIMRQAMVDSGSKTKSSEPITISDGSVIALEAPTNRSFASILHYLQLAPLATISYFILAGVKSPSNDQGAVIARNLTMELNMISNRTLRLSSTTPFVPISWALIQTNYDFWEPLPFPAADPRRTVLTKHFEKDGQSRIATVWGLLESLSITSSSNGVNGVLNVGTAFSVILVPANSSLRSYLRNSTGCCA